MKKRQRTYQYEVLATLSLLFFLSPSLEAAINPSLHRCLKSLQKNGVLSVVYRQPVFWVVLKPQEIPGIQKHLSLQWPYRKNPSTRQIESEVSRILTGRQSPDGSFVIVIDDNYRIWCWMLPLNDPHAAEQPEMNYGKLMWFDDLPKRWKTENSEIEELPKKWEILDISFGSIETDDRPYVDIKLGDRKSNQTLKRRYSLPHFTYRE